MSKRHPLTEARSCTTCRHLQSGMVFDLCTRPESEYRIEGKVDFHTIGHMRSARDKCTPDGALHEKA